jgi:hypothetical protein
LAQSELLNAGLDAGAQVSQLTTDPAAVDHIFDPEAAFLAEGHIAHAPGFGFMARLA